MHILLTNDDGPLNDQTCPYIKYLVDEINSTTDWKLSICVPDQQRSWIGKAHFAGKPLGAKYIYTQESTRQAVDLSKDSVNGFQGPFEKPQDLPGHQEWVLIDSTPAACADIGLHHLADKVDLVVSGPNFGKNTSTLYSLTSGTIGAAMEAVTHGFRAVALSYGFFEKTHRHEILRSAAKISVALIQHLYDNWGDCDLYTVNVPLVKSLELGKTRIKYCPILENTWGSIYTAHKEDGKVEFSWTPDFQKVWRDGLADVGYTDSRVLIEGDVSVTPLRAAFKVVSPIEGEIILEERKERKEKEEHIIQTPSLFLQLSPDNYLYEPLSRAFSHFNLVTSIDPATPTFHYCEYEDMDFDRVGQPTYFTPSYVYRKGLIRKHYLANTVRYYVAKHPESILARAIPETFLLEVDYAEFLDDALDESYELRDEINKGDRVWILKPSMSDKGQGIRLFKTIDELQEIFNSFEEENENENDNENEEENEENENEDNGIIISQLRHFVVQEYKTNPCLLDAYGKRKFHLRTYVVAAGDLTVYVYRNILALFAGKPYKDPKNGVDLSAHLTNTCLQDEGLVVPFWELDGLDDKEGVFRQVCDVIGDVFAAAVSVDRMNFQPVPTAVEMFGVDLLVDADNSVSLLEINSYPDFKQTGQELKGLVEELFVGVASVVETLMGSPENSSPERSEGSQRSAKETQKTDLLVSVYKH